MGKKLIICVLIISFVIQMAGCGTPNKRYQAQFLELFDTVTTIIGYAPDKETFSEYAQMVYNELKRYHELYDIYNNYDGMNNVKTINDNAGIAPVKVDQEIIDLLLFAKEGYKTTYGECNVALGAVLKVWHDYREAGSEDPANAKLPPMELLQEKAKHTDIDKLIINETDSTVYLEDPEMSLDVGAVAKGYATERVAQYMKQNGCKSILLSVGGNVRAVGEREGDEKDKLWNVGIQNPDLQSEDKYLLITKIADLSLVSSGDYERYYTVEGKEYHHIIDKDTLMPADYYTAVSIICEDSGLADLYAKPAYNMPLDEAKKFIESQDGVEAMWVMKDGELVFSSGFEKYIKE